jgi:hypothetical protein
MIQGLEVGKPLENKGFPESPNPSGSTEGSSSSESVSNDAILADLIGDGTVAPESTLPPDIRFVVNQWQDLPEATQRAILAIVRAAGSQADSSEQNRPARSTKAFLPGSG